MHSQIQQKVPGNCPICGMELINEIAASRQGVTRNDETYKPLFIIIFLILLTSLVLTVKDVLTESFSLQNSMRYFMAGFFLVFAGFKFLDLKGFTMGYRTYDLLAKRVFGYGYLYPFLELSLGFCYATGFTPPAINLFTFILMGFSGIGVLIKILKKEKFQCACLGRFLKVPLTKVTLVEDFGMAVMALLMLFLR